MTDADRFRPELDGLRAVAVLAVVLYHVGVPGFGGGYVGVDVFFVISGFLITSNLLHEVERSGGVSLLDFWARRLRRLMPALVAVTIATLLAGLVVLAPLELAKVARDAVAAITYTSNIVAGRAAGNYFARNVEPSLFLHTWSLGVEEQFYLLWPLGVAALAWVGRRRSTATAGRIAVVVLAALSAASLAGAVLLTDRGSPWAFYSLPTRVWEFGLAAMLAVSLRSPRFAALTARTVAANVAAVAGITAIVVSIVTFSPPLAYPGLLTLVPVVGAVLVVAAGGSATPLRPVLSWGPAQWLGRMSYSWYLWHWPAMWLTEAALERSSRTIRLVAVLASLVPAVASHHLVEQPLRFHRRLVTSRRLTAAMAVVGLVAVVAAAAGSTALGDRWSDTAEGRAIRAARADTSFAAVESCRGGRWLEAGVVCRIGSHPDRRPILLVGDSHGAHWSDAVRLAARRLGVDLVIRVRYQCPAFPVAIVQSEIAPHPNDGCLAWQRGNQAVVDELRPAAIVVAEADYLDVMLDGRPERALRSAMVTQFEAWRQAGAAVLMIGSTPELPSDPLTCVGRERSVTRCTPRRADALARTRAVRSVEAAAVAAVPTARRWDPVPALCPGTTCSIGDLDGFVFSDSGHITASYARSRSPELTDALRDLLAAP